MELVDPGRSYVQKSRVGSANDVERQGPSHYYTLTCRWTCPSYNSNIVNLGLGIVSV